MKIKFNTLTYFFAVLFILTAVVQCDNVTDPGSPHTPPPTSPDPGEPSGIELISPVDQAENQSTEVALNWGKNDNADNYNVQISESDEFNSTIVDTLIEENSFTTSDLSNESTYHWRVSARINGSNGGWTRTWSFTTGVDDPDPYSVELLMPEKGEKIPVYDITFEWSSVSETEKYRFQLALESDFSDLVKDSVTSSSSLEITELQEESYYYWRVIPLPESGSGEWSEVFEIETEIDDNGSTEPVPEVTLLTPANYSADKSVSFDFEWESIDDFEDYQIQVSTSSSFNQSEIDETVADNKFEISDLDHNQMYFWRVRVVSDNSGDSWNEEETWSEVWEFTTEAQPAPPQSNSEFVTVENANFVVDGEVFRFAGTNAYYLPNYEKINSGVVDRAFDAFEEAGITVVRMWAFYDGYDCGYSRNDSSENVIQTAPGEYSESALRDLDRVIAKGKERGIRFILPFVNYWNELGGICQYNTWAGASNPGTNTEFFINNSNTQRWYRDYVEMLLNRVNTETGVAYKDEPAIFSWQIMNEGRNRGGDPRVMRDWYQEIAQFIKSIDSNHMVSTGEDGFDEGVPSEYSVSEYSNQYVLRAQEGTSYIMNTAIPEIDYGNAHWYAEDFGFGSGVGSSVLQAQRTWISDHADIAASFGKPFVLGEYGHVNGWGDNNTLTSYQDLWDHAEQIQLDGSTIWQFTADNEKCFEFGGNICYPSGRKDTALYNSFRDHIQNMNNSR